jgi:3-oxoacyl-[acyl-carrier protein] reductase
MSHTTPHHTALVTGAGAGLGRAIAISLARDSFDVAVYCHTNLEGAQETASTIHAIGRKAFVFQADLSQDSQAQELAEKVTTHFGSLDLLVNNAGSYTERHGLELSEQEWFDGLNSTVTQTFFTTRSLLPILRAGALKRIINIGDSSCDRPGARDLAWSYHVGKTGVWMLTRSLAASEAQYGIQVNMVSPGFLENSQGSLPPLEIPAGRHGSFEDVYSAIRFLALNAPAYLTGSNLVVSGGWNLR